MIGGLPIRFDQRVEVLLFVEALRPVLAEVFELEVFFGDLPGDGTDDDRTRLFVGVLLDPDRTTMTGFRFRGTGYAGRARLFPCVW